MPEDSEISRKFCEVLSLNIPAHEGLQSQTGPATALQMSRSLINKVFTLHMTQTAITL